MKKLLLAGAITLVAGIASAETILLDYTEIHGDSQRVIAFSEAVTINTVTEKVCSVSGANEFRYDGGIAKECDQFQDLPDFVQANILTALEARGHAWRPTVLETLADQAGDVAKGFKERMKDIGKGE